MASSSSKREENDQQHEDDEEKKVLKLLLESIGEPQEDDNLLSKQPWENQRSKEKKKLYQSYKDKGAFSSTPDPLKHLFGNFLNPVGAQNEFDIIQKEYRKLLTLKKAPSCTDCVVHIDTKDFIPWNVWMNKFEHMKKNGRVEKEQDKDENENDSNQTGANEADGMNEILMENASEGGTESIDEQKVEELTPDINNFVSNWNSDDESQSSATTLESSRVLSVEEF